MILVRTALEWKPADMRVFGMKVECGRKVFESAVKVHFPEFVNCVAVTYGREHAQS